MTGPNLLHEELNLSTVHANNGSDRPLCGADLLGGETTAVAYQVDCKDCLGPEGLAGAIAAKRAELDAEVAGFRQPTSVADGTVAFNVSDLTPAMRKALLDGSALRQTAQALVNRGLVSSWDLFRPDGRHPLNLTEAGRRAASAIRREKTADWNAMPAMKSALASEISSTGWCYSSKTTTVNALVRRGFATVDTTSLSPRNFRLTPAGQRAREALQSARDAALNELAAKVETDEKIDEIAQARRELDAAFAKLERLTTLRDRLIEARDALTRAFADLDGANQEAPAIDPTRPGWFMVGQGISNYAAGMHYRVNAIERDKLGKVSAVAATSNNGYANTWAWYGDHPDAVGNLGTLEGPHIGLRDEDRRNWPSSTASALRAIRNVLEDQVLSGFATIAGESTKRPAHITVVLPHGTEPTRHLELLRRYVPYHCAVETARNYGTDIIRILPRKV